MSIAPERILRKVAHVTTYDQPRRGYFRGCEDERPFGRDETLLPSLGWNIRAGALSKKPLLSLLFFVDALDGWFWFDGLPHGG